MPAGNPSSYLLHPISNLAAVEEHGAHCSVRGDGIRVYDRDGNEYLEAAAGAWCLGLGHGDEEIADAAAEQMRELPYVPAFYGRTSEPLERLAERLVRMAPFEASRVFFTNSGSEANDTLVRLLWYAANGAGEPERKRILAHDFGYHGSAGLSASLTGLTPFHEGFDAPASFVRRVTAPEFMTFALPGETEAEFVTRLADELDMLIQHDGPHTFAAFISEPVLAAGGVRIPPAGYFPAIQRVLERYDIPLAGDEVVTGFWRTGRQWGAETMEMRPATLTVAKQLTAAYAPMGALLIDEALYERVLAASRSHSVFGHGFTYGGHPVSAAVALTVLDIYERRGIDASVARASTRFAARLEALREHELVAHTQSVGLLGAIVLHNDREPELDIGALCSAATLDAGLLVRQSNNRTYLCPPLIITPEEVDELFDRYTTALDALLARVTPVHRGG